MSFATERGFVAGQKYLTIGKTTNADIPVGTVVTFKDDDLSSMPAFYCSEEYDRDGWAYISLDDVSNVPLNQDEPVKPTTYSVNINETSSLITVNKPLSAEVVAKIVGLLAG